MMMNPFEEEQYPQSTLLTGPQTHLQPTNSLLTVPPAYTPQYSEEDRINPRRQFWAGMLMDLGNMFGSWNGNQFTRPLTGMGFKQSNLAHTQNQRMNAANQRGAQQHYQNQFNYDKANLGQQNYDNQQQALADYRAQQQANTDRTFGYQAGRDQVADQQWNADFIASQWKPRTLPDGRVVMENRALGPEASYLTQPLTTVEQGQTAHQQQKLIEESQGRGAETDRASSAQGFLSDIVGDADYNIGNWGQRAQQVFGDVTGYGGDGARDNSTRLSNYMNQFTLGETDKLAGVLTDKDMQLLARTKPEMKDGRDAITRWLYSVVQAEERYKEMAELRRQHEASGQPLHTFDEAGNYRRMLERDNDARDEYISRLKTSGRSNGSELQQRRDRALQRAQELQTAPEYNTGF
jgi:hypothetical protein